MDTLNFAENFEKPKIAFKTSLQNSSESFEESSKAKASENTMVTCKC